MTSFPHLRPRRTDAVFTLGLLLFCTTACDVVSARYAAGDFDYRTDNSSLDDKTKAYLVGARLETAPKKTGASGGLEAEMLVTDDDLFATAAGAASVRAFEITPYVTFRPDYGSMFRAPIDLGLTFHRLTLRQDPGVDVVWDTLGAKLAVRPELDLIRGSKGSLSLYGNASGIIGVTTAEVEGTNVDDFNGQSWLLGLEGGVKYQRRSFFFGGGFLSRRFVSEETDRASGPVIAGVDHEFTGWSVFAGVVF